MSVRSLRFTGKETEAPGPTPVTAVLGLDPGLPEGRASTQVRGQGRDPESYLFWRRARGLAHPQGPRPEGF